MAGPFGGKRMDTGLSEAIATDADDDSYDLGWAQSVPSEPNQARQFYASS